jgi:ribulose-5-phosphate 4-epimerase/fuculose-1-phosphate aldolase
MSKTWEHYRHAARHHKQAAYHYQEAAKYDEAEEHEKAAHHAYLAHGHGQHAIHHDVEAAKLLAEQCDSSATPASGEEAKKRSAA